MNRINTINLESLPPYYQKACGKLQQNLRDAATNEEKIKHCDKFLENHFMIPVLWYDFFELLTSTEALPRTIEEYSYQALSQFYSEELYPFLILSSKPFTKTIEACQYLYAKTKYMNKEQLEDGLTFPHEHLDDLYYHYIQLTEKPMPPKIYKYYLNSKKMYEKLCAVYDDEKKWIHVLAASTSNEDYIKQNIEARIAREFGNKKLWKLYIRYLEDTKDMWILSIYCRYCNFFMEDLGMREKYLDKIEYYAKLEKPISKWWIDVISFTFNHGSPEDIKEMIQKALSLASVDFPELHMFLRYDLEDVVPKSMFKELQTEIEKTYDRVSLNRNKKWCSYFPVAFLCEKPFVNMGKSEILPNFDRELFGLNHANLIMRRNADRGKEFTPKRTKPFNFAPQYFSLTKPIMRYIMDNASFSVRVKLYKVCKYFFHTHKFVPAFTVKVNNFTPPRSHSNQLSLSCSVQHESFRNLNNLWITGSFSSSNNQATTRLMPKVAKFEPQIITLQNQRIPFSTFKDLMKRGSCKVLKLAATSFAQADGNSANLNEIIEASPSVVNFSFCSPAMRVNNVQLSKLVRANKIQNFTFKFVHDVLEIPTFLQFLKKNVAPCCKIKICFDETATPPYRNQMKEALKLFNNEMPTFCGKKWIIYNIRDFSL